MFFRLKPTRPGQVLKLVESYRDDTARPRHRAVASLGDAAGGSCGLEAVGPADDAESKILVKFIRKRIDPARAEGLRLAS